MQQKRGSLHTGCTSVQKITSVSTLLRAHKQLLRSSCAAISLFLFYLLVISGSLSRKKLKVTNHKNGTNSTGYSSHLLDHKDTGLQPESNDPAGHQHVSAG